MIFGINVIVIRKLDTAEEMTDTIILLFFQAEEHGVLFMPVPGQKRYEGKALYNFGRATIYIDRGVAFVSRGDQWTPVSLDGLVKLVS